MYMHRGGDALQNARTAANCAPNGDLYLQVRPSNSSCVHFIRFKFRAGPTDRPCDAINTYTHVHLIHPPPNQSTTNAQVMHYPKYEDLWHNVLILAAMFVGCMGLAYLALKRSTPL